MKRASRTAATSSDDEDEGAAAPGDAGVLDAYVKNPTPGVVLVFEASRWDFEGEDKTKIEILARSEILVIPSRREGFPRVVAEAMASGLPTVTVDFPENGTKTVVLQYGIGKVAKPDARELATTVAAVLQDWRTYSEKALEHSKELDWKILVQKLLT